MDDDPNWPIVDWQYEVANGDTKLGYAEWLMHQREMNIDDAMMPEEGFLTPNDTPPDPPWWWKK